MELKLNTSPKYEKKADKILKPLLDLLKKLTLLEEEILKEMRLSK